MFKGIVNSLIVSASSAALCTYFSALTAYGLYAYNFSAEKVRLHLHHGHPGHAHPGHRHGFLR